MLTPLGWGIAAVSVLLYGAGALLGHPEPAALGLAGALAVAGALLWTLPQPRLEVTRDISPAKLTRGDAAVAVLKVTGRGILRAHDVVGGSTVEVVLPRLPAAVTYGLPTSRRGELPVGPLRLVRSDPLGLARRVRSYGAAQTVLVQPRTVQVGPLPSGRDDHSAGPATDHAPSGAVTFHTLRGYVVGDDLRHVHWKSSARTGTLMVRRFGDGSLPRSTVALDTSPWPDPEAFELAVEVTASAALGCRAAGLPVTVLADTPATGDLLDFLARVAPSEDAVLVDLLRSARPGGSLIVVAGPGFPCARLPEIVRRFDRIVCLRIRPGAPSPALRGIAVIDLHTLEDLPTVWTTLR